MHRGLGAVRTSIPQGEIDSMSCPSKTVSVDRLALSGLLGLMVAIVNLKQYPSHLCIELDRMIGKS